MTTSTDAPSQPPKSSQEGPITTFLDLATEYMLTHLRSVTSGMGLQNALAQFYMGAERIKLMLLGSLFLTSWLTVLLLFWIGCNLQFRSLSDRVPLDRLSPSHAPTFDPSDAVPSTLPERSADR
jgi:hypothetical protein